jgi:predicted DNA repair protein MutK
MRALNILCGISVLFTTLAFWHIIHHHIVHSPHEAYRSLHFWAMVVPTACAGILSFVGGILLLKRPR